MVPPLCRAYSQLKMKVRALPTCRNPVGDGAKRTRGFAPEDVEGIDSGIRGRSFDGMGPGQHRQLAAKNSRLSNSFQVTRVRDTVLKSCCARTPTCENINYRPSPKLLTHIFAGSLSRGS